MVNYIFDFDGTIADSLPAFITVFNKVVRGDDNALTDEELLKFRSMTSRQALRMAGIRWWQIPKLLISGMGDFHDLVPTMQTFKGLPAVIKKMYERGDRLYIVTSNTHENVGKFLELHGLNMYFSDISTGASLFRKSGYISRLIRKHNLKRKHTVYIGDETRDVQAARLARLKTVSVTWGFNTEEILRKQRPAYIINKPLELLDIVL
ncbi:HAD hydrolase-like protein [Candidatus Saccharibacteria bacterium]|nr:HAD hydrolase-like protein [Candidatus Saccharibacteria bacterium]